MKNSIATATLSLELHLSIIVCKLHCRISARNHNQMLSQPDFKFCHSCDSCCHYLSNKLGLDFVHYRVTDPITDPIDTSQPFSVSEHRGERVAEKQPEGEELFDFFCFLECFPELKLLSRTR